jgi:DNA invertase Pin-like site-specific DNA recombinase
MAIHNIDHTKPVTAAIYSRISTSDHSQDLGLQTNEMKEYCQRRGWQCIEYSDICSGTKDRRPGLDQMMRDANQYKFTSVIVWKFDRMARSVSHLINTLTILNHRGIRFISLTQDLDTGTSTGKLLYGLLALIAEFEGDLCRERIRAGLRNAKLKGRLPGPKGPRFDIDMVDVSARICAGESQRHIATTLGISPALLCKRLKILGSAKEVQNVAQV